MFSSEIYINIYNQSFTLTCTGVNIGYFTLHIKYKYMYTYFNNLNVTHLVKIYKVISISFIEKIEQNKSNFDNIAKS